MPSSRLRIPPPKGRAIAYDRHFADVRIGRSGNRRGVPPPCRGRSASKASRVGVNRNDLAHRGTPPPPPGASLPPGDLPPAGGGATSFPRPPPGPFPSNTLKPAPCRSHPL